MADVNKRTVLRKKPTQLRRRDDIRPLEQAAVGSTVVVTCYTECLQVSGNVVMSSITHRGVGLLPDHLI